MLQIHLILFPNLEYTWYFGFAGPRSFLGNVVGVVPEAIGAYRVSVYFDRICNVTVKRGVKTLHVAKNVYV